MAKKKSKSKAVGKKSTRAKKGSGSPPVVTGTVTLSKRRGKFHVEVDSATAKKFEKLLSEDNLIHAGLVAHEANNINIPGVPEHGGEG